MSVSTVTRWDHFCKRMCTKSPKTEEGSFEFSNTRKAKKTQDEDPIFQGICWLIDGVGCADWEKAVNTARQKAVNTARPHSTVVNAVRVNQENAIKASACWVWRPTKLDSASITLKKHNYGKPQQDDTRFIDSGCSRHMTGNIPYLLDFKEYDGGYVTFGGGAHGGRISRKGTLKTDSLDFKNVYFVNELNFNLSTCVTDCGPTESKSDLINLGWKQKWNELSNPSSNRQKLEREDERGIVIRNKEFGCTPGHRQEDGEKLFGEDVVDILVRVKEANCGLPPLQTEDESEGLLPSCCGEKLLWILKKSIAWIHGLFPEFLSLILAKHIEYAVKASPLTVLYEGEARRVYQDTSISGPIKDGSGEGSPIKELWRLHGTRVALDCLLAVRSRAGPNAEVVFGRSFLRITKGIVDFRKGILTIYPDLITFNDDDLDAILASIDVSDVQPLDVTDISPFMCSMGKSARNKKQHSKNYKMSYNGEGPSLTVKRPLTQEELSREELENDIYERILILNEPRLIIETLKYSDQHKKLLDSVILDKLKLDGEVEVTRLLKKKMIPEYLFYPFVWSDSDDEEEYCLKRDEMGKPFYGPNRAKYLSCDDPMDRALALQEVLNPFKKICVWKKVIAFLGSLHVPLQHVVPNHSGNFAKKTVGTNNDEAGSSRPKRTRQHKIVEEAMLLRGVLNNWVMPKKLKRCLRLRCTRWEEKRRYSVLKLGDASLTSMNQYVKLCHEFYSTYEFDEVVMDEELMTKKLIKFRLAGHGHSLTLLEFARRLGLYSSHEIHNGGFELYFQGGLRNDDHFNANEYWLSISSEEELHLSRSAASTIRNPILRVLQKMITYVAKEKRSRSLDDTTLRELIGSNGRLIAKDPAPGVPRFAMPRPPLPICRIYTRG
ncbi:hypothetical protein Tco_0073169 [Tanacetum coccineum]